MRCVSLMAALSLFACTEYEVKRVSTDVAPPATEPPATDAPGTDPPATEPPATTPPGLAPDIEVDRFEMDFGGVVPECSLTHSINVGNVGTADLVITGIEMLNYGPGFVSLDGPLVLAPNEQAQLRVEFTPDESGSFFDALEITSNDPDEGVVQVTLAGEGDLLAVLEETFEQEGDAAQPVDILFVIDNSTSMLDTNQQLQNNFNTFMQSFLTLGLDFQIGVVTTDMQTATDAGQLQGPIITTSTPNPVQQFNQNTNLGFTDVLEEQGLDAAYHALSAPLINGVNAGLVRADSLLSVIVISDEDDQSATTPTQMINLLDTYHNDPDKTSLSIVGGPRAGIFPCGTFFQSAAPVPTYWEVAQATGGIHLNLCQLDMAQIVSQLAVVAAGLDTEFFLNTTPPDPSQLEVLVDGSVIDEGGSDGWSYDYGNNSISFAGTSIPQAGALIRVRIPDAASCP